jgi:hypothetical protein
LVQIATPFPGKSITFFSIQSELIAAEARNWAVQADQVLDQEE